MRLLPRLFFLAWCVAVIPRPGYSTTEFRGLYVDAFHPGFKNHQEVTQMVNAAKQANINALIVQVRKRGDAYYDSHIEPKASDIAPDYDPLADVIAQAHAIGLQVHAWISVYEIMYTGYTPAANHIYILHPEWLMRVQNGGTETPGGKFFLDPGIPEVQAYTVSIIKDIAKHYAVDGIHLDNVRYPANLAGYNEISLSLFGKESGRAGVPEPNDEAWCEWRRNQVTDLVRQSKTALQEVRPNAVLSASVMMGPAMMASRYYMQDWDKWMQEGIVDFVVPMIYKTEDVMPEWAAYSLSSRHDRHLYVGIGAYRISSELAEKHIRDAMAVGTDGVVIYSYHYASRNSTDPKCAKLSDLRSTVFQEACSIPTMQWRE